MKTNWQVSFFLLLFAASISAASPARAQTCQKSDKILPPTRFVGGSGGDLDFNDDDIAFKWGEISKIEIWAADFVDAIKVTYGNAGFADLHGGGGGNPGGNKSVLTLGPGEFITEVTGTSGTFLDRICFSVNGREPSCYGGGGGDRFAFNRGGLPLRSIRGRSGRFVDKIAFSFGNNSMIDLNSIAYDTSKLDEELARSTSKLVKQFVKNSSNTQQGVKYNQNDQLTHSTTIYWSNEVGETQTHQVGAKMTISTGDRKAGAEGSFELNYSYTNSKSITSTNAVTNTDEDTLSNGWEVTVDVPAHSTITAISTWKNVTIDLPFFYDMLYLNDQGQTVCRAPQRGTIRGVTSYDLRHEYAETPAK
jgi:hypothetical protein